MANAIAITRAKFSNCFTVCRHPPESSRCPPANASTATTAASVMVQQARGEDGRPQAGSGTEGCGTTRCTADVARDSRRKPTPLPRGIAAPQLAQSPTAPRAAHSPHSLHLAARPLVSLVLSVYLLEYTTVPYAYMLRLRSVQDDEEGQQPNHSELSHRARAKLLVSVAVVASASKRLVRWRRR